MLYVRLRTPHGSFSRLLVDLQRRVLGHYLDPNRKPREVGYTNMLVGDSDHWTSIPMSLRAKLMKEYVVKNFHGHSLIDYALAVEKVTISKKDVVRCPLLFV